MLQSWAEIKWHRVCIICLESGNKFGSSFARFDGTGRTRSRGIKQEVQWGKPDACENARTTLFCKVLVWTKSAIDWNWELQQMACRKSHSNATTKRKLIMIKWWNTWLVHKNTITNRQWIQCDTSRLQRNDEESKRPAKWCGVFGQVLLEEKERRKSRNHSEWIRKMNWRCERSMMFVPASTRIKKRYPHVWWTSTSIDRCAWSRFEPRTKETANVKQETTILLLKWRRWIRFRRFELKRLH